MSDKNLPKWFETHTLIFDFDGVFTDNKVTTRQDGLEEVSCNRGDGLAFDMLRRFIDIKNWDLRYFILSKETNPVVSIRASKMNVECIQSVSRKSDYISEYLASQELTSHGLIYLGNDLNDIEAMALAGYSVVPSDAHPLVLKQADLVLPQQGGQGFVRRFIELLINLDEMSLSQVYGLL